ncbi:MAG: hypothetical protein KGM24_14405 [Elusimicrobia bacterium]|nr:hypothetical protein [Elusimicrobiota bacterium]
MNPSRGLAAALLAAVLCAPAAAQETDYAVLSGSCTGRAPAPPRISGGPAYDWKAAPPSDDVRALWTAAGDRYDEASGHLLDVSSRPVSQADYRRQMSPFDASYESVDPLVWSSLMSGGYRLDEKTCRLVSPDGKGPLLRLQVEVYRRGLQAGYRREQLTELLASLRGLPLGAKIPAEVLERARQAEQAGVALPPNVRRLLADAGTTVGDLRGAVLPSYEASTRFFDSARGLKETALRALPPIAGISAPERRPAYYDSLSTRLGRAFDADLKSQFESVKPSGPRMLGRFPDGLPPIVMMKISQRPWEKGRGRAAAQADPANGAIEINYWDAARVALESAPAASRAALTKDFADPATLARYLLAHPEARKAFISREDVVLYHELTHVWQQHRDAVALEDLRGNVPAMEPLEYEHEAFREQFRYLTDKLAVQPREALQGGWTDSYRLLLQEGYERFNDEQIDKNYVGTFAGVSNFKTVEQVQAERRSIASRLEASSPTLYGKALELLKLAGLSRGASALREDARAYRGRAAEFVVKILPEMRRAGYPRLVAAYEKYGTPAQALAAALEMPRPKGAPFGVPEDEARRLAAAAAKELSSTAGAAMSYERYEAWTAYGGYVDRTGARWPDGLARQAQGEWEKAAEDELRKAAAEKDPAVRAGELKWARAYATWTPPADRAALERRSRALGGRS